MSEAVTGLTMRTSILSEESLARDMHTHTQMDRLGLSTSKFAVT